MLLTSEVPFLPVMQTTGESGGAATEIISQIPYVPARLAWRTARGLLRDDNQDAMIVGKTPHRDGVMLGVFDGMGGLDRGQEASQMAAKTFVDARSKASAEPTEAWLLEAMRDANHAVWSMTEKDGRVGTTATVACAFEDKLIVCHVGDSRCYMLRDNYLRGDGMLNQLTTDHTMIEGLIQSGKTREEAEASGWGNVVLEAVGVLASVSPEVVTMDLRPRDTLLLSTDGLHGFVSDDVLAAILRESRSPYEAAYKLVKKAYEGASDDNVSVIVAMF